MDVRESTVPDSTADGIPDLVETGYPGVDPSDVITLSEGERYVDADFGYLPRPGTAAFGDRVWHDTNGDGVQDDGELGIPGVDIIVSGPGGDTTITTGADGFWMATGLTAAVGDALQRQLRRGHRAGGSHPDLPRRRLLPGDG